MTTTVAEILTAAETLLDAHAFQDYCPIGLQVAASAGGAAPVTKIATSVSSTLETFARAHEAGAELVLVHHGLFWKGTPQVVDGAMRARLHALLAHDMTLAGYHLPLDAHATLGNNALICDGLGLTRLDLPFVDHGGRSIGFVGELPGDGLGADELAHRVQELMSGRAPLVLGAFPGRVRRIGVCSGGSAASVVEAAALGCDAFLTGEPREDTHALARELGIGFLAAGHHATEVFGIRALGTELSSRFGVEHVFLDADNPV
ncbi:MAG: Nif3-like dinuclear metal center hexameric protein [Thermoleophilia bacterium]|nr:Nif3-like dinuclear metal center hexameric protein [Thermoleophilia bacterium]MCZ4495803.1 Nif3-like dinuclear metal center hexameric protein [Thermoleophilia bacterium]